MRKGKSTLAIAIAYWIFLKLQELGLIPKKERFTCKYIARDQSEFGEMIKDSVNIYDTVRVIDEFNEMEETGENSTIERALRNTFSDVQAMRHIHRISCSPKDNPDKN